MKIQALTCSLLALTGLAQAQETGQVISRTPVYQQVATPRQICNQVTPAPTPSSGGGAMVGAIAGGLIGNALGGGDRGIATMAGVVGGAILGDKAEASNNSQPVTTCQTQTTYENRLVGYNVVYEYAGKQYNVQLAQDPGPTIPLQVTPVGAPAAPAVVAPATVSTPTSVTTVVAPPPVVYAPSPYYYRPWPVTTSINLGWGWYGGGGHRHWR